MVNYNNGKICKIEPICTHDEGDIYIGSTTKEYLSQRMSKHKTDYKRWLQGKQGYLTSYKLFDKYDIKNCQIILIESVNANSKDELHSREAHYIKMSKCVNNKIPLRSKQEYRDDNKEKIKIKNKLFYQDNKQYFLDIQEKKSEYQKEKRTHPFYCKCGSQYTYGHKLRHLQTKKHCEFIENNIL